MLYPSMSASSSIPIKNPSPEPSRFQHEEYKPHAKQPHPTTPPRPPLYPVVKHTPRTRCVPQPALSELSVSPWSHHDRLRICRPRPPTPCNHAHRRTTCAQIIAPTTCYRTGRSVARRSRRADLSSRRSAQYPRAVEILRTTVFASPRTVV